MRGSPLTIQKYFPGHEVSSRFREEWKSSRGNGVNGFFFASFFHVSAECGFFVFEKLRACLKTLSRREIFKMFAKNMKIEEGYPKVT